MTKTAEIVESKKGKTQVRIIAIVVGLALLAAMYFLSAGAMKATPPTDTPRVVSLTVVGFFGFAGEETGVPTALFLRRVDDYRRILVASSGAEGEIVTQAARFSLADGAMSLSVREINDDEYMDVVCGNLVLYGSEGGLVVW